MNRLALSVLAATCLFSSTGCMMDADYDDGDDVVDEDLGVATQAINGTHFGQYKLRIDATNAEKWKAKWWCVESDDSLTLIDADTFPASSRTTRKTNITAAKCATGQWKVSFHLKKNSNWRDVKPGAGVCGNKDWCGYADDNEFELFEPAEDQFDRYARPDQDWTNSKDKLCVVAINEWFDKIYLYKEPCG